MTGAAHPLLSEPQGKTLEFKRDLSSPQNALKTLVAFADSAGVRLSVALAQPHVAGAGAPRVTTSAATAPATAPEEASRLESKLAARIFVLLLARESGKAALAQSLGHRSVSGELHKQIGRLLERGLIAMTLPEKPTSRLQRYRLTPRGQALAAELLTPEHPTP